MAKVTKSHAGKMSMWLLCKGMRGENYIGESGSEDGGADDRNRRVQGEEVALP